MSSSYITKKYELGSVYDLMMISRVFSWSSRTPGMCNLCNIYLHIYIYNIYLYSGWYIIYCVETFLYYKFITDPSGIWVSYSRTKNGYLPTDTLYNINVDRRIMYIFVSYWYSQRWMDAEEQKRTTGEEKKKK